MASIRSIFLSSAAMAVVRAQSSCFTLHGTIDDATDVNFVQVLANPDGGYYTSFVDDEASATLFGINGVGDSVNILIDYTDEGRVANIGSNNDFDSIYFDFQESLGNSDDLALDCGLDADNTLICSAQDDPDVHVFNYCNGDVWLSNGPRVDFAECQGLTLRASDAEGCTLSSSTTTSSSTVAVTSTTSATTETSTVSTTSTTSSSTASSQNSTSSASAPVFTSSVPTPSRTRKGCGRKPTTTPTKNPSYYLRAHLN